MPTKVLREVVALMLSEFARRLGGVAAVWAAKRVVVADWSIAIGGIR